MTGNVGPQQQTSTELSKNLYQLNLLKFCKIPYAEFTYQLK